MRRCASFDTATSTAQSFVPPLSLAVADPDARVLSLEKSTRNPYVGFIFVGRATTNDVIVRDASVSKSHAVFEQTDAGWCLRDNRSHNGTFVNRIRLSDGERAPLASGALVVFGSYPAYFVEADQLSRFLR